MHVLKDEKLGVDREYVAVDRNAEVGEKIIVTFSRDFPEGVIANVKELDDSYDDGSCYLDKDHRGDGYLDGTLEEYRVLEPTDIVHIDGERYRLEDRKAEAGEKIIVTKSDDFPIGFVDSVSYFDDFCVDGSCALVNGFNGIDYFDGLDDYYNVLTPIQDAAEAQESDVITVLANLGAEVAELKRTVARHQAEINALHEDKVRLGEQLAKVAADGPKALSFTADELAQVVVSLKKAGL
ncbi:hypothetical protein [Bacillus pumilus]|uniref:hypothetical protein n=1 Tax=Bacillus pumilus TaxID=1408 RepID=UPI00119EA91A|nr:hypothetical protein [Bacillus pumilus]